MYNIKSTMIILKKERKKEQIVIQLQHVYNVYVLLLCAQKGYKINELVKKYIYACYNFNPSFIFVAPSMKIEHSLLFSKTFLKA